jgi:hypothetical protein
MGTAETAQPRGDPGETSEDPLLADKRPFNSSPATTRNGDAYSASSTRG